MKLRETMEQLDLANAALQRPQLSPVAATALRRWSLYQRGSEDKISATDWLEAVLMTRASRWVRWIRRTTTMRVSE